MTKAKLQWYLDLLGTVCPDDIVEGDPVDILCKIRDLHPPQEDLERVIHFYLMSVMSDDRPPIATLNAYYHFLKIIPGMTLDELEEACEAFDNDTK